jgi:hypothetical protein
MNFIRLRKRLVVNLDQVIAGEFRPPEPGVRARLDLTTTAIQTELGAGEYVQTALVLTTVGDDAERVWQYLQSLAAPNAMAEDLDRVRESLKLQAPVDEVDPAHEEYVDDQPGQA